MNAQIINLEAKEMSISITETDIGILYIIQHELLNASNVNFAGVIVKHPLTNECWMRINSSTKPLTEVKKSTESALKMAEEFTELFNSKLR